jgi:hypothetical protein
MKNRYLLCLFLFIPLLATASVVLPPPTQFLTLQNGVPATIRLKQQVGQAGQSLLVFPKQDCVRITVTPYGNNPAGWLLLNMSSTMVYSTTRTNPIILFHRKQAFDSYKFQQGFIYAEKVSIFRVTFADLPASRCPPAPALADASDLEEVDEDENVSAEW